MTAIYIQTIINVQTVHGQMRESGCCHGNFDYTSWTEDIVHHLCPIIHACHKLFKMMSFLVFLY